MTSKLISRTLCFGKRRVTVSLEPAFWEAMDDIARRERLTFPALCAEIEEVRPVEVTLTAAIRVFVVAYHRALGEPPGLMPSVGGVQSLTLH